MYNGINRNSKLFTPELCDELNNSFSKTLEKIEKFSPKDLEPEYPSSVIDVVPVANVDIRNNSFTVGNEKWISIVISTKEEITDSPIANIEITSTGPVFVQFVKKNTVKNKVPGQINGGVLSVAGTLEANTDYLVSTYLL